MMRCDKTGLTDKDFKTILDVLNVYDPNDIIDHIPAMGTPEFMQDVQSAFKAVLAHVNRNKYGSDMGAFAAAAEQYTDDDLSRAGVDTVVDELDEQDYAEADKQRAAEEYARVEALAYEQYIHSLS